MESCPPDPICAWGPWDFSENTACKVGRRPTAQNRCLLTRKCSQWTTAELGGIYAVRKQTTREGRGGGGAAVGPQGGLKGKKHEWPRWVLKSLPGAPGPTRAPGRTWVQVLSVGLRLQLGAPAVTIPICIPEQPLSVSDVPLNLPGILLICRFLTP